MESSSLTTPLLLPAAATNLSRKQKMSIETDRLVPRPGNGVVDIRYGTMLSTLSATDIEEIRKFVAADVVSRTKDDVRKRDVFQRIADKTETAATIMYGLSSILAFTATAFVEYGKLFSFLAGVFSTAGVVVSGWSRDASAESNERISRLNAILTSLGLDTVPINAEKVGDEKTNVKEEIIPPTNN